MYDVGAEGALGVTAARACGGHAAMCECEALRAVTSDLALHYMAHYHSSAA